jgi:Tol biopolymer transport system component
MALQPGTRVGPYEIKSLLGAGGMGEVFLAHDARLGRDVALKVLPAQYSSDPDRLRRFEIEARAASQLNHPNILTVFDIGTDSGQPYVVAERLEGETLRDRLARGPLGERESLEVARQVARGLAAAHARGIVHRDLKPENLFLTRDGHVKILDFGLAKLTSDGSASDTKIETAYATEAGVIVGTVQYMAPEQVKGQAVDQRTDLFSFGAVLHEMLTGKGPFTRPSRAESMSAVLNDTPRAVDEERPGIPPLLARVVEHCLEKAPEQRFQSARDLIFALDSAGTRSGAASGPGPAPAIVARARRGVPAAMIAVAAAMLGLLLGWWFGAARPRSDAAPAFKRVIRFAATDDSEFSPALSPDGKWVAYLRDTSDRCDLWVKFLTGAEAVNLTGALPDLYVARRDVIGGIDIAPDGSTILFSAGTTPRVGATAASVYVIGAPLGGAPRKLISNAASARWSPDGKKLVYIRPGGSAGDRIEVSDADGENARVLVPLSGGIHAHWPAWSGDGKTIYFLRSISTQNLEPSEIYRVDVAGGPAEPVVSTTRRAVYPSPASDGSGLLYSANPDSPELALWWMPTGGQPVRLTTGIGEYSEARMSSDKRTVVATVNQDRRSLMAVPLVGAASELTELTPGSSGDLDPAISPRGDRIAFSSTRSGSRRIWTSRLDGSDARELTSGDAIDERPAWSPDGSTIAFVSSRGPSRAIWRVAADGSDLRKVVDAQVIDVVTWSPDGSELAYSAPSGTAPAIFRVHVSGGDPVRVATPEGATSPSWSTKRNQIAYVANSPAQPGSGSRAVIGIVTPDGHAVPTNGSDSKALQIGNGQVAWSPDGRVIAAMSNPGQRPSEILLIQVDSTGPPTLVITVKSSQQFRGLDWSADQSRLIVGVSERTSDIVLFDQGS